MTEPEQSDPTSFDAAPEGGGDRRRLALIGVAAAVVLAAAGYFLIGGGGGGSSDDALVLPVVHHVTRPVGTAIKPVTAHAVLPPASTVKLGRDPFHPLYVIPVAPVAASPGTGTTGTTGGTTTTGGTETPTTPDKPVNTTYALRLSRVDGSGTNLTAKFLIGSSSKIQYARAGSVFGRSAEIRLLSLQQGANGSGTAVIQVGDGSPFDISTKDSAIFVQ